MTAPVKSRANFMMSLVPRSGKTAARCKGLSVVAYPATVEASGYSVRQVHARNGVIAHIARINNDQLTFVFRFVIKQSSIGSRRLRWMRLLRARRPAHRHSGQRRADEPSIHHYSCRTFETQPPLASRRRILPCSHSDAYDQRCCRGHVEIQPLCRRSDVRLRAAEIDEWSIGAEPAVLPPAPGFMEWAIRQTSITMSSPSS